MASEGQPVLTLHYSQPPPHHPSPSPSSLGYGMAKREPRRMLWRDASPVDDEPCSLGVCLYRLKLARVAQSISVAVGFPWQRDA